MAEKNNNLDLYYKFLNQEITKIQLLSYVPQEVLHRSINAEINDETIQTILNKFDVLLGKEQVRGVIGGPPCQAFSTIGRAQNAHKKATDGRIYLYRYYIDFLERYSPDFFVFENVKGLLSFKDADGEPLLAKIIKEFNEAGYSLGYRIENTKNYGVPQSRERIIIFGVPLGHESLIESFFSTLESFQEPEVSLEKALSDLPFVKAGSQNNVYNKKPTEYVALHYRLDSRTPLTQNIARANNINDLKIYKEVVKSKHEGHNMKYNELSERLKTHKHQDKFLDRYKALDYNRPSHTIVAHIAKDGHHYIHPDIDQNRSITLREAARIQGFSDDFYFENSRTAAFIQIGNAVPPIFSEKIAKAIRELNLT